jgi:phosphoglycerate dehydrogenase-like enzyme
MRVCVHHPQGERYAELIRAQRPALDVRVAADEPGLRQQLREAEVLVAFRFPLDAIDDAPRLRWIQVTSAGTEFLASARERLAGVVVTNGRGVHAAPIADYVLGAGVMLLSDWPSFLRAQAARQWQRRPVTALAGKVMGMIGLGSIGQEIARRARAFGLDVLGVRRSAQPVPGVTDVVPPSELRSVLPRCDLVVVTVPLTDQTRGMIGAAELRAMKRGAFLINVSRGGVVDEEALIGALRDGHVAGACLDVFATEPLPADSPLWTLPNVIVTPHIAGMRGDYEPLLVAIFLDNLGRLERGAPLRNVVDLARGY